FNAITITQIGILSGLKQFKELAYINIIIGIITFLASVLLTFYKGFTGAIVSLVISQTVNCLLNWIAINKKLNTISIISVNKKLSKIKREIIKFSLPISLQ